MLEDKLNNKIIRHDKYHILSRKVKVLLKYKFKV